MKFDMISVEGIDKSGKGLVLKYIQHLGDYSHVLLDRGPLSCYMFSKMFNRNVEYDIADFTNVLIIFLDVLKADWDVRCKISNEPAISFYEHCRLYNEAIQVFEDCGCTVLRYSTTQMTPYRIALDAMSFFEKANNEDKERHS